MKNIETKGCSRSPGGALRGVGLPEHQLRSPGVTCTSILWAGGQGWSGNWSVWEFSPLDSWCPKKLPSLIFRRMAPWTTQRLLPARAASSRPSPLQPTSQAGLAFPARPSQHAWSLTLGETPALHLWDRPLKMSRPQPGQPAAPLGSLTPLSLPHPGHRDLGPVASLPDSPVLQSPLPDFLTHLKTGTPPPHSTLMLLCLRKGQTPRPSAPWG